MTNNIFSSNHIQYQNTLMFNKVYGVDVRSPTTTEKIENYEIYIFVPNSKNVEFIKSLI